MGSMSLRRWPAPPVLRPAHCSSARREVLRELYDSDRVPATGFRHYFKAGAAEEARSASARGPRQSYEWFAQAAEELVPSYKVEVAKSQRSECQAKGTAKQHGDDSFIEKGTLRFGSINEQSGGRVPAHRCPLAPRPLPLGAAPCAAPWRRPLAPPLGAAPCAAPGRRPFAPPLAAAPGSRPFALPLRAAPWRSRAHPRSRAPM